MSQAIRRGIVALTLLYACSGAAQEPAETPNWVEGGRATIILESSPRAGRPATRDDLAALRGLGEFEGGLALSPDGRSLALIERRTDRVHNKLRHDLIVVDAHTGDARILADAGAYLFASVRGRRGGAPLPRAPIWSPDGSRIAFIAEREGRAELWAIAMPDGTGARVAELPGDVQAITWSADGAIIARIGTPRTELARIARQDVAYGFALGDRFDALYHVGRIADDSAGASVVRIDPATGLVSPANDTESAGLSGEAQGRGFPRARIVATGDHPDAAGAILAPAVELADGARVVCALAACLARFRQVFLSARGDIVYFVRPDAEDAEMSVRAWDRAAQTTRLIYRTQGQLHGCQLAGASLYCLEESFQRPREIVSIDLSTGARRVLYNPNPQWAAIAAPRVDRLDIIDSAGNASFGRLVYPLHWRSGRRYPLVIVQYRARGFLGAGVSGEYPVLPLSARGYFVLAVDRPEVEAVRRVYGFTETQMRTELDGSEIDVKIASIALMLRALEARRLIDGDRVAITGMSDGAETLYALLDRGWRFRAAISSSPPMDRASWWLMSSAYRATLQRQGAITAPYSDTDPRWSAWWDRMSSAEHADQYQPALLLNLAQTELISALPLRTRLQELGRPVELYLHPNAYHLKPMPSQIEAIQERNLAWIDLWLRDLDTESAIEPERRARWRAMVEAQEARAAGD
ncbi:Atxe2 family lasso peptide isopeptidase [Vitreimonas sp.]|uniref:Atxe2 family lasso peptide isopeptidase n=1 Tax=Vitreimonas sp. TaxID=3069702 RepID=UPI002EDB35E5